MIFSFFCFVLLAAFLVCLGLFALAVTKVVAPDGKGHARGFFGGCAAMVALFLLCFLGLVGLAATVGALALGNVRHWNPVRSIEVFGDHERHDDGNWDDSWRDELRSDELRSDELRGYELRGDEPGRGDVHSEDPRSEAEPGAPARSEDDSAHLPRHSIYARFAVHGDAGSDLAALLGRVIELDLDRLDDSLRVSTRTEPDGSETRLYEFRLPIRASEVAHFEENLRLELDGLRLKLPEGVRIEFEGTRD